MGSEKEQRGADAHQPGGSHYKRVSGDLEHWNAVTALGWDYLVGAATKYLWRLGEKDDPVLELEKAMHFLQKKREVLLAERAAKPLACCPEAKPTVVDESTATTPRFHVRCEGCGGRYAPFRSAREAMRDYLGRWRGGKPWEVK